ncbi:hypothetical protein A2U01_0091487, partial [Trifolium medium]|nr:hypothetical protein [Trifolium medium]
MDKTGDPRDGREASLFLSTVEDRDDIQIFTGRQLEKRPQSTQEKPVDRAQPA